MMRPTHRDFRDASRPVRMPPSLPLEIRHFELASMVSQYGGGPYDEYATVYPQQWTGQAWQTILDDDLKFEIFNPLGYFQARGHGAFPAPNDRGSLGVAYFSYESGLWELLQIEPAAQWIRGRVVRDFPFYATQFQIEKIEICFPTSSLIVDQNPGSGSGPWFMGPMTIFNRAVYIDEVGHSALPGKKGDIVEARWNRTPEGFSSPGWEAIQTSRIPDYWIVESP